MTTANTVANTAEEITSLADEVFYVVLSESTDPRVRDYLCIAGMRTHIARLVATGDFTAESALALLRENVIWINRDTFQKGDLKDTLVTVEAVNKLANGAYELGLDLNLGEVMINHPDGPDFKLRELDGTIQNAHAHGKFTFSAEELQKNGLAQAVADYHREVEKAVANGGVSRNEQTAAKRIVIAKGSKGFGLKGLCFGEQRSAEGVNLSGMFFCVSNPTLTPEGRESRSLLAGAIAFVAFKNANARAAADLIGMDDLAAAVEAAGLSAIDVFRPLAGTTAPAPDATSDAVAAPQRQRLSAMLKR
jgi:hypothetical protein